MLRNCLRINEKCIVDGNTGIIFSSSLEKHVFCGFSLEVPQLGSSKKYPQHIFYEEIRKLILELSPNTHHLQSCVHSFRSTPLYVNCLHKKRNLREVLETKIDTGLDRYSTVPL